MVLCLSTIFPVREVHAGLPLVAVAVGMEMGSSLVLRNIANRVAVQSVGIAANDASWAAAAQTMTGAIRLFLGLGVGYNTTAGDPTQYDIQVSDQLPPKAQGQTRYGVTDWATPQVITMPMQVTKTQESIPITLAKGGYDDPQYFVAALAEVWDLYALPQYMFASGSSIGNMWGDDPICANEYVPGHSIKIFLPYDQKHTICIKSSISEGNDDRYRLIADSQNIGWIADRTDPDWAPYELNAMSGPVNLQFRGPNESGAQSAVIMYKIDNALYIRSLNETVVNEVPGLMDRILQVNKITTAAQAVQETFVGGKTIENYAPALNTPIGSQLGINPADGSGTGTASPINFPDDYARQATLQAEVTNTGKISDAFTTQATNVTDPTTPTGSDFENAFFKGTFTNLLGWSAPAHTSACPSSSFDAFGRSFTVDAHCQLVNDNFTGVRQAMAVVYALLALFVVLRA